MRKQPILVARDIAKQYYGQTVVHAVRKADLRVYEGDFVLILGPSGSGKSTLLTMLGGLDRPSRGQIILLDQSYFHLEEIELTRLRQRNLGYVFQYFNLLHSLSALDNVALPLRLMELSEAEIEQRSLDMLEQVGLKDRAHHLPAQLSGGEQQRVALARALVHNPQVVLADEPTGNLDSTNAEMIKRLLSRLNQERKQTFVVVSHDASFRHFANRVVYMSDGEIDRIEVKPRDTD